MLPPKRHPLWRLTAARGLSAQRFLADSAGRVALDRLAPMASQATPMEALRGLSVLICSARQLPAALTLLHLDGVASRLVLCPPDLAAAHLPAVVEAAGIDAIVSDGSGPLSPDVSIPVFAAPSRPPSTEYGGTTTEWLLFTSGTTGRPKLVTHTLDSLSAPFHNGRSQGPAAVAPVWATFYDIRRYGGLQVLLRALLGGGSMVLSQAGETVGDFLSRAGRDGVTHFSGTPSHWRQALMTQSATQISPRYIRLSGEVVDQAILNNLAAAYPRAKIGHAFASTEAGVAFEVDDGLSGFPASLLETPGDDVGLRIVDGSLRIRSERVARRYLGTDVSLVDASGFVDTADMLELRGERYHFVGRREGVINVGGMKVHPEEVEAVINQHPFVQMARVRARASPVTGALVVADVVVRADAGPCSFPALREELLTACRQALPAYKVPAMLYEVSALAITGSGKLLRQRA